MASWHDVAARAELTEDQPLGVQVGKLEIGLYQLGEEILALEDECPHAYQLLSQGFVMDGCVECPLHAAKFDIRSGRFVDGPGCRDLKTFPVKVEGDRILVQVA